MSERLTLTCILSSLAKFSLLRYNLIRYTSKLLGNTHFYQLNSSTLQATNKLLLSPERMASLIDDIEGDEWERRVIRDLFDGPRLKAIPMNSKKRAIVLKWFANRFEYGVRYQESEVNEIIKRHHPDWAYWRRELVGAGLLAREKGIYWRVPGETGGASMS